MRRLALASVIALTLTVTTASLADTEAPTAPAVKEAAPPVVASPTPPAIVKAPVVAAAPPPVTPAPAPVKVAVVPAVALAPATPPAPVVAPVIAAAPPPAVAAPAAPAQEADLPLALRPTKDLALAPEPAHIPWPYKLLFGGAVLAAAVLVWKKRRALAGKAPTAAAVRVLSKTATGMRGELALVEVGGMRLLIGITPGSMQTLAILPDESSELVDLSLREEERAAAALPARREAPKSELAARARSLFSSLDLGPAPPARAPAPGSSYAASRYAEERDMEAAPESAPAPTRAPRRRAPREVPLEGQARGLALALGKAK